jgi:large subunit ribosomal protein L32
MFVWLAHPAVESHRAHPYGVGLLREAAERRAQPGGKSLLKFGLTVLGGPSTLHRFSAIAGIAVWPDRPGGGFLKESVAMQPKKNSSKARKNKRRSHLAKALPHVDYCPGCGAPRLSHHACWRCGHVNPRVSLAVDEES